MPYDKTDPQDRMDMLEEDFGKPDQFDDDYNDEGGGELEARLNHFYGDREPEQVRTNYEEYCYMLRNNNQWHR